MLAAILALFLCPGGQVASAQGARAVKAADGWSPGLAPGAVFRDCADCPEMVVVPPGKFVMGSPAGEAGRYRFEGPQRVVTIPRAFAVGRFEVTRAQWARFVADSGYAAGAGCYVWNGSRVDWNPSAGWRSPGMPQGDGEPVVCVNWAGANAYARWLAKKTGKPYRLPSDADWEYAARAGNRTSRPWGDDPAQACRFANVADRTGQQRFPAWVAHACADGAVFTSPAGRFRANAFGLYDMIGNAWEWAEDCWIDNLAGIPDDGSARTSGDCGARVMRGGSWLSPPQFARSAARQWLDASYRFADLGFRVVRSR